MRQKDACRGLQEEGSTTTPFDMMLSNHISRYRVAMGAVRGAVLVNERVALGAIELNSNCNEPQRVI